MFTADDAMAAESGARAWRRMHGRLLVVESRRARRNRRGTVRRYRVWFTVGRAAPVVAKRWVAFAASCTTCSARRFRAVAADDHGSHGTLDCEARVQKDPGRASVPQSRSMSWRVGIQPQFGAAARSDAR